MARIAPGWIAMLNTAHFDASYPSNSVARIRCPVDDTGRNSVSPSTMPRMIAVSQIIGGSLHAEVGRGRGSWAGIRVAGGSRRAAGGGRGPLACVSEVRGGV